MVIDETTKELEQLYDQKIRESKLLAESGASTQFPLRPGFATGLGREIMVWTNYVRLDIPDIIIYRFHIEVKPCKPLVPDPKGKKLKRIIQLLCKRHHRLSMMRSDMSALLYGPENLLNNGLSFLDYSILYYPEGQNPSANDASNYKVRITSAGPPMETKQLREYLELRSPSCANRIEIIQAINSILSHHCHMQNNFITIGNNNKHFRLDDDTNQEDLGRGMLILRGFSKSVRPATGRLLLNVNVANAVAYSPQRLPDLARAFGLVNLESLENFLIKLRVTVSHSKRINSEAGNPIPTVKTICGLARKDDGVGSTERPQVKDFGGPKDVLFRREMDGKKQMVSIWEHFAEVYKLEMDETLPVVCTGNRSTNPIYLPMEVCWVIPGQLCKENLTALQRTKMIKFTCRKPKVNAESIMKDGLPSLGLESKILQQYKMAVKPAFVVAPAFILSPPQLQYRSRQNPFPLKPAVVSNGSWNMESVRFQKGTQLEEGTWDYVWIHYDVRDRDGKLLNNPFESSGGSPASKIAELVAEMRKCGIDVRERLNLNAKIALKPERSEQDFWRNEENIQRCLKKIYIDNKNRLRLLLVILPTYNASYYNEIKRSLDQRAGLTSVCVAADKFVRGGLQYFANVALKVNLKLGGTNHVINKTSLADLDLIKKQKTMVCGLDVTHPSPGSHLNAPSIAGMVYCLDDDLAQWRSFLWLQSQERREMTTDLKNKFTSALKLWQERNSSLPENVILYRDGVSEGQYDHVLKMEVNSQIRTAFDETYGPGRSPKLSVIVVGKRHGTRFYPTNPKNMDPKTSNCLPGTVVERGITDAHQWDFFFLAHKG